MRSILLSALALAMFASNQALLAAPCAGFADVDDASAFCPNVEWVRNRSITLGCTSTTVYCPNANVSRLQMAAFLNRLGTAMTPIERRADASPGALDLDTAPIVCQTPPFDTTTFPRRAIVDGAFHATAPADVSFGSELVMTIDGGANWTPLTSEPSAGSIGAGRWAGIPSIAHADLAHGQTVRFGIRASRLAFPGTADVTDSRCQLRALIFSRDGASSPY